MPQFYMLVGAPGSGKSTWTRNFLAKTDDDYVVISSDDIIVEWGKLLDPNMTYTDAFRKVDMKKVQAELNSRLMAAIADMKNIIWDQTNLTAKSRRGRVSRIPKIYRKTCVVFNIEHDELFRRLEKRAKEEGKFIPKKVIDDMIKTFEPPVESEGFDKIIQV
ncbi:MAG: ATP-binding protein [Gammaproteobacteria bacterium]|nr:ATP-binding protein [Gammaproteobacteria bacterium]